MNYIWIEREHILIYLKINFIHDKYDLTLLFLRQTDLHNTLKYGQSVKKALKYGKYGFST